MYKWLGKDGIREGEGKKEKENERVRGEKGYSVMGKRENGREIGRQKEKKDVTNSK